MWSKLELVLLFAETIKTGPVPWWVRAPASRHDHPTRHLSSDLHEGALEWWCYLRTREIYNILKNNKTNTKNETLLMETGGKRATHGLLPEVLPPDGFTGWRLCYQLLQGIEKKDDLTIAIPRSPAIEPFTLWLSHPHSPRNLFIVLCL